jgi:hypothetical protein
MPSDETLRFTLVCKLPLLHFSRSRVAVVQRLSYASFNARFSTVSSLRFVETRKQVSTATLSGATSEEVT